MTYDTQRTEMIVKHLKVSKRYSEQAEHINDEIQMLLADVDSLDEYEKLRLLSELTRQLSAKTCKLLNQ